MGPRRAGRRLASALAAMCRSASSRSDTQDLLLLRLELLLGDDALRLELGELLEFRRVVRLRRCGGYRRGRRRIRLLRRDLLLVRLLVLPRVLLLLVV